MPGSHYPDSPTSRLRRALFGSIAASTLLLACGDDGPASTDEAESSETDTSTTDTTDTSTTDTTEGTDTTESTDTTDTGETDTTETTDGPPDCGPAEPIGDWLFMVIDGVFPNDVPNDVDESCTVVQGSEGALALDCPFGAFELQLLLADPPALPALGATAQVRLHHEPGWQNWPDLWIHVDVEGGDLYAFQASSALHPTQGQYVVPWEPSPTNATCGPIEDICGPQQVEELGFVVEGEPASAWHNAYVTTSIAEREFEVWLLAARENLEPPETCDFSPTWYSLVGHRER